MPTPEQQVRIERGLEMLPPRFHRVASWLLRTWLGRTLVEFSFGLQRIEVFDRSMAVAAQVFTSVFPVLILLASWFGETSRLLNDTLDIPPEAEAAVDQALKSSTSTTFGLIGALIVLISATSLSRALARAFAVIWEIPRPRSNVGSAWRWLAVVLGLALVMVSLRRVHTITDALPPEGLWTVVTVGFGYTLMALLIPVILLKRAVSLRALLPGAVIFGLVSVLVRPFADVWLPQALEHSALRYGSIGVAFTYLAWFYVYSWIYLASAVLGRAVVTDEGRVGRWLAGPAPLVRVALTQDAEESE